MDTTQYLLQENTANRIAGVDEVGRGCLAGPVVAACVVIPHELNNLEFKDSKLLSEKKRLTLYSKLLPYPDHIGLGIVSHRQIDKINILNATLLAMKKAILNCKQASTEIRVDGNKAPTIKGYKIEAIIKGDQLYQEISAASIIAKVIRDRLLSKYHTIYPNYELNINKGYGTETHYEALFTHGQSPIHRKSFNLSKQTSLF